MICLEKKAVPPDDPEEFQRRAATLDVDGGVRTPRVRKIAES
jgi:hypothetical protein